MAAPTSAMTERVPHLSSVRHEWARLFHKPWIELTVVAGNVAVVVLGWNLLPITWRDWVFDDAHGPIAFAIALQSWLLADVTSTNLLGHDEGGSVAALTHRSTRPAVAALLRTKSLVIGSIIGLATGAAALALTWDRPRALQHTVSFLPGLVSAPIGLVALASLVGVLFPYRNRSLQWRWEHLRDWKVSLRWGLLLLAPYAVMGAVATGFLWGTRRLADLITGFKGRGRPPSEAIAAMGAIAVVVSALAWAVFPALWARLADHHRSRLLAYFANPDAG